MIRGGRQGYDRLRVLAAAHARHTAELLTAVGVGSGMRCLDLGCGGGDVTFEMARRVAPGGRVTGLDMDEVKLSLARASADERGFTNVEFRAGDVRSWDEPDAFDFVYSRFLLSHLRSPLDLLRRMWAAVKPGGAIAVEDTDFDGPFCHPPNSGFAFWARSFPAVIARGGGDAAIGRKLRWYFVEAGIPDPTMRLVQNVYPPNEIGKTLPALSIEATAEAIIDEGIATRAEVTAALADLTAFTNDPDAVVGGPRVFQVWAQRPLEQ